jgi:MYXO-CTERM domain-containing protein
VCAAAPEGCACSRTPGPPSLPAWLAGLAALAGVLARRRQRAAAMAKNARGR